MTARQRMECAIEALTYIESGQLSKAEAWYRKWRHKNSLPTTVGGALVKAISESALELIAPEVPTWHSHLRHLRRPE